MEVHRLKTAALLKFPTRWWHNTALLELPGTRPVWSLGSFIIIFRSCLLRKKTLACASGALGSRKEQHGYLSLALGGSQLFKSGCKVGRGNNVLEQSDAGSYWPNVLQKVKLA